LKVEVSGYKKGRKTGYIYTLVDFYNEKSGVTAMARTTAYTASIVAKLILEGKIGLRGVVPPERLGMDNEVYRHVIFELSKREIRISEETFIG
jgi:lysine 6-dehydrogenase